MTKEIHSEQDLKEAVYEQDGYVLMNVRAGWCRPCQVMRPTFESTEQAFEGKIKLCSLDVNEQEDLAERFRAPGIPTYILFRDGQEIGRIVGYRQKEKFFALLKEFLEK